MVPLRKRTKSANNSSFAKKLQIYKKNAKEYGL